MNMSKNSSSNLVDCGLLKCAYDYSHIYNDPVTGDVILCNDLLGNCILSNITVFEPRMLKEDVAMKLIKSTDSIGLVSSTKYLITLTEDKAHYRLWTDPTTIKFTVDYDTDNCYDYPINEEETQHID